LVFFGPVDLISIFRAKIDLPLPRASFELFPFFFSHFKWAAPFLAFPECACFERAYPYNAGLSEKARDKPADAEFSDPLTLCSLSLE